MPGHDVAGPHFPGIALDRWALGCCRLKRRTAPLRGGMDMAVARSVERCERKNLDWLEIRDDAGEVWRYGKRRLAPGSAGVHLTWRFDEEKRLRAILVREKDGTTLLRQAEPGLPDNMVVDYFEIPAIPWAQAARGGKYEYGRD